MFVFKAIPNIRCKAAIVMAFIVLLLAACGQGAAEKTSAPLFTLGPSSQAVLEGATATFSIAASGNPAPTFQWERSDDSENTWSTIAGEISSTYSFTAKAIDNNALFRVRAANTLGVENSTAAKLKVISGAPIINSFAASPVVLTYGRSTTLVWDVSGSSTLTINQGVGDVTGKTSMVLTPNLYGSSTYTLLATNVFGTTSATATITAVAPAKIEQFTAVSDVIAPNAKATLTPVFTGGSGSIDHGVGTVTSGSSVETGPLSSVTTFTLAVTNPAGETVTSSLVVYVAPGTFSLVPGHLSVAHNSPQATLLPNGKVLIRELTSEKTGADLYDPQTNAFTPLANFQVGYLATLLPDGRVLLNGSTSTEADVWDPRTDTHVRLSMARGHASAVLLLNGKVLLAGQAGYQAELFDPVTMTFSPTSMAQIKDSGYGATLLRNGNVLLTGIYANELYDYRTGFFSLTGAFTSPHENGNFSQPTLLKTAPHAGKVFISGENLHQGIGTYIAGKTAELFDPNTGVFHQTGQMIDDREMATQVQLASGQVLVVGGWRWLGRYNFFSLSAELFNPETGSFSKTAYPIFHKKFPSGVLLPNGKVLIPGGEKYRANLGEPEVTVLDIAELFDPGDGILPSIPDATLSLQTSVSSGTANLTATLPDTPEAFYFWQIKGGVITSGLGTRTITYTAGAAGTITVDCLVVSVDNIPAHAHADVTVLP